MVDGNGRNPGMKEILNVAKNIGINNKRAKSIANDIQEIVYYDLKKYVKRDKD